MVGRVFCLLIDNVDDGDGFSEHVFVLFGTVFVQQGAGSWIMEPLWERG